MKGVFVGEWGSFGQGDGEFAGVTGIAVASDDKVYVADGVNRIQVFKRVQVRK